MFFLNDELQLFISTTIYSSSSVKSSLFFLTEKPVYVMKYAATENNLNKLSRLR